MGETLVVWEGNKKIAAVTVLGIKGNQVRIGVEADRNINVDREEIYERKRQNQNV